MVRNVKCFTLKMSKDEKEQKWLWWCAELWIGRWCEQSAPFSNPPCYGFLGRVLLTSLWKGGFTLRWPVCLPSRHRLFTAFETYLFSLQSRRVLDILKVQVSWTHKVFWKNHYIIKYLEYVSSTIHSVTQKPLEVPSHPLARIIIEIATWLSWLL